jgi:isocitrate dehydrogenase
MTKENMEMQTLHGTFNGEVVELHSTPPIEGETHVLVTFLEGSLETAAAREQRLGHYGDPLGPPHVYGAELRKQMASQYRRYTVGAIMSRTPVTVEPTAKVAVALHMMRQKGVTSVLVNPAAGASSEDWGIMTMRDILKHIVVERRSPETVIVGEIATRNLIRTSPDASLRECAEMMLQANVRRVVIYQDTTPVGIISDTDIFQFVEERGWGQDSG